MSERVSDEKLASMVETGAKWRVDDAAVHLALCELQDLRKSMSEPKRANEHARNLISIAYDLEGEERDRQSNECLGAAAEIERLAARVAELEAKLQSSI